MNIGNISAAVTVVRTIREDWDIRLVRGQIETLADGDYTHADILWVCVTVAENRNNRAPTMLTSLAQELISKLHEKTAVNRTWTGSPGRRDDGFLCDKCNKTEQQCQSAAGNLDGRDHAFVSIRRAEVEREQQRAANSPERMEAKAEFARHKTGLFAMPADIDHHQHPEPEQESA